MIFHAEATAEKISIQMHGPITDGGWDESTVGASQVAKVLAEATAPMVTVSINSDGGDMFSGIAIRNLLRRYAADRSAKIETRVAGIAASAASIVAMAGDEIVMELGSMMMIHNPWTFAMGDATELRAQADVLDKAREGLVEIYRAKSGKSAAEIRRLMQAETWYSAEEAKREGFATAIADKPVKASAAVVINGETFDRSRVPGRLWNQIVPPAAPVPAPPAPVTRASLPTALLAELLAEGAAAERLRLQELDELGLAEQPADLIAAKYTDRIRAPELAMRVLKQQRAPGSALLAQRRIESAGLLGIRQPAQPLDNRAAEEAAGERIAAYANARIKERTQR